MASGTSNLTKKFFFNVKFENSNQFLTDFPISSEQKAYTVGISKTSPIRINHNPEFDPTPPLGVGGRGLKKFFLTDSDSASKIKVLKFFGLRPPQDPSDHYVHTYLVQILKRVD